MTFREKFKYYKQKNPKPGFEEVLDFSQLESNFKGISSRTSVCEPTDEDLSSLGLQEVNQWRIFELIDKPGLIFIRNPFTAAGQRLWVERSLTEYTKRPSKLNLDAHGDLEPNEDWWTVCCRDSDRSAVLQRKLRWATLGYHHNWDTKKYSESNRSKFPDDLARLSRVVIRTVLGLDEFVAEAAILNYYHMDSTLSGHVDSSETNLEAPLISFSFGQSAIFLIGGTSLEDTPTPMFIHSGDIVIMSGFSRLCYHGVPRIVPAPRTPWDENRTSSACSESSVNSQDKLANICDSWSTISDYIKTSRINLNVRQVSNCSETLLKEA
ncbi:unnamed protein product [Bemisia tabaci]|uniref:Fe2OG dioxygenase domain-containing protein n=1 Tax=Bemisia tabaci TaxID=7038 RepID=A0A9P0A8L3_BEMTA|nr:unnamed protein product [Bemisia tabaci]